MANGIKNFSQHPSILKIKENTNFSACFSFRTVSKADLLYQLNSLDPAKATQKCDIPTKIIKKNYDIFSEFLLENFKNIILTSLFPEQLKYADVKPIFKKDSRNDKRNYRPVSILSIISKIYERLLYKQLETYQKYYFVYLQELILLIFVSSHMAFVNILIFPAIFELHDGIKIISSRLPLILSSYRTRFAVWNLSSTDSFIV